MFGDVKHALRLAQTTAQQVVQGLIILVALALMATCRGAVALG
jgi:hypothetical protein